MKFDERLEERFVEKIDFDFQTECWVWTAKLTHGYGMFWIGDREFRAHRIAYELWIGEIVGEGTIDHLCANRACVNPLHLEQVSRAENSRRMGYRGAPGFQAAKTHCKLGHEFTEENTYVNVTSGSRQCKVCSREAAKRYRRKLHTERMRKYHEEAPVYGSARTTA